MIATSYLMKIEAADIEPEHGGGYVFRGRATQEHGGGARMKVKVRFPASHPPENIVHTTMLFGKEKFKIPLHPAQRPTVDAVVAWVRAGRKRAWVHVAKVGDRWAARLRTDQGGGDGPIAADAAAASTVPDGDYAMRTAAWYVEAINQHDGERLMLRTNFRASSPPPDTIGDAAKFGDAFFLFDYRDDRLGLQTSMDATTKLINATVTLAHGYEEPVRIGFVRLDQMGRNVTVDLRMRGGRGAMTFENSEGAFGPFS